MAEGAVAVLGVLKHNSGVPGAALVAGRVCVMTPRTQMDLLWVSVSRLVTSAGL